jgi:nicotinamide mononucleotide adenylyltransferase
MKKFFAFLHEAVSSQAVQQATRMGLQSDGHGGWYKDGEFVAKTVKGKLVFYNKRQSVGGKDPAQTPKEKNISNPNFVDPAQQQQQAPVDPNAAVDPNAQIDPATGQPVQAAPPPPPIPVPPAVEKTKGTLTITFGRFNPPTIGHQQLMDTVAGAAGEEDFLIVPSRSQDKKKNPLDADTKIAYMQKMFPQYAGNIVNDPNTRTIFDVLKKAHNDGYANVRIVGGADRVKEFDKLANNYNGSLYQFDGIEVISAGDRDPDAEGIEGMSASKLRLAASEGDFLTFRDGLPDTLSRKEALELFYNIRNSMGIKEGVEVWEIAPKFDAQTLRENYLSETIFKIGHFVENLNTGLVGRIIRRGTNYLICVTEDNIMFKSWIKDVTEAYSEKKMERMMRDKKHPNTLVGTGGYFKYALKQTPGSDMGSNNLATGQTSYIKDFLNKYRKK